MVNVLAITSNLWYNYSMEVIKILWIVTFFFFTLILIFIWSKGIVITNRIKTVSALIEKIEEIDNNVVKEETVAKEDTAEAGG